MKYHPWVETHGLKVPQPAPVETVNELVIDGKKIHIGIGIHDSSSSLAPYFAGKKGKFLLLSTGTWCINMNPFNTETLTAEQLDKDCLCYMSITGQPVKSSRLFLGHLHETAINLIAEHFGKPQNFYKKIKADKKLSASLKSKFADKRVFFNPGPFSPVLKEYIDMYEFKSFEESYHQLMNELCSLTVLSVNLVLPKDDDITTIYITGGFSKNELFLNLITEAFPTKNVYTSEITNSSALGAALIIAGNKPDLNLGLVSLSKPAK
jgi:sugar (pentulose or hexulose) kinase